MHICSSAIPNAALKNFPLQPEELFIILNFCFCILDQIAQLVWISCRLVERIEELFVLILASDFLPLVSLEVKKVSCRVGNFLQVLKCVTNDTFLKVYSVKRVFENLSIRIELVNYILVGLLYKNDNK